VSRWIRFLLPPAIVLGGLFMTVALVRSKPKVDPQEPEVIPPLVQVVAVEKRDVRLTVTAEGTVLPRTESTLAARVAGEVVAVAPSFEVGGFFDRGEALVTLDARDYEVAVERRKAEVAAARLRQAQEEAEARVAAEEWDGLGEAAPDPLVLREPQLAEARAALAAAEAELRKARLDLERTRITAPFAGRVRSKAVDVGQYLTPGQAVATVHAVDYAEVRLPVPDGELAFLDLPWSFRAGTTAPGLEVTLAANLRGELYRWPARIVRTEGELDPRSRMHYLVARVEDPYRRRGAGEGPPLLIGSFVGAEITGREVRDAVELPRTALRGEDRVWVVDEDQRLVFRPVEILRTQAESVVIGGGLESGERVCVSALDFAVAGMAVRTEASEGSPTP
jgi:RND family efflux transporter MFP subunit